MTPSPSSSHHIEELSWITSIPLTVGAKQVRQDLYTLMSRRVMVVSAEALGTILGEAATAADLGGSSKYSNFFIQNIFLHYLFFFLIYTLRKSGFLSLL